MGTIAMQAGPIGWQDGQSRKRAGAAQTRARVARLQLEDAPKFFLIRSFLAVALVLGTIFWCCWQVLFASKAEEYRSSDLAGMAWRGSSAGASAIFWLWSWHACYTMRSELRMKNAIFAIFAMFAIFAIFVSKIM